MSNPRQTFALQVCLLLFCSETKFCYQYPTPFVFSTRTASFSTATDQIRTHSCNHHFAFGHEHVRDSECASSMEEQETVGCILFVTKPSSISCGTLNQQQRFHPVNINSTALPLPLQVISMAIILWQQGPTRQHPQLLAYQQLRYLAFNVNLCSDIPAPLQLQNTAFFVR